MALSAKSFIPILLHKPTVKAIFFENFFYFFLKDCLQQQIQGLANLKTRIIKQFHYSRFFAFKSIAKKFFYAERQK
ncbi:MAG TPA: hypothetical protein DD738_11865 [Ruminiclostridium sp.]|nr:hypothetical protein [Ruminiclostridium sp.]